MKALGLLLGAGVLALSAGQANATIYLGLQNSDVNGGAITQIASDGDTGNLSYSGSYGGFSNSVITQGFPKLPQPVLQTASINSQNDAGVAGKLTIYITQTGLNAITGNLISSFTSNLFQGAVQSVLEQTYLDSGNGLFGGKLLASTLFDSTTTFPNAGGPGLGTNSVSTPVGGLTGKFSETTKYTITVGSGASSVNDSINLSAGAGAVPEPASWALMLAGFGFMGYSLRRRRREAVSFG